jgi:hypothetical protein
MNLTFSNATAKNSRNRRRSNSFLMVSPEKSALLSFLIVILHESGTRKAISWSDTIYIKTVSNQCNLTAQLEPVHDIYYYPNNTA